MVQYIHHHINPIISIDNQFSKKKTILDLRKTESREHTIQSLDKSSVNTLKCPHNRTPHLIIRILSKVSFNSVNCFSIIYSILINLSAQSVRRSIANTK